MEEFLKQFIGKSVDVSCTAAPVVRGEVVDVKTGILHLRDEDENLSYVAIDKIAVIGEVKESVTRPGFVS